MKIKSEAVELKKVLDKIIGVKHHQIWLEKEVFPYIKRQDPHGAGELCEFFGVEISEFQSWKWLEQMPKDHIQKIRRRVEDRLRKSTLWEILRVAELLSVPTGTE